MGTVNIKEILEYLEERGLYKRIERTKTDYDMKESLQIVDAIGKSRNKKFKIDDENKFVYENMIKFVHADESMKCHDPETKNHVKGDVNKGIYIAGTVGSGKSWAMEILAGYALLIRNMVKFGDEERPLCWKGVRAATICDEYASKGVFDKYKNLPILCIQDMASEPGESLFMGNRMNVLRQILEYRGDQTDMMTLITSNLPINHKGITTIYSDRVASRLFEMVNYFELTGKDRRKL